MCTRFGADSSNRFPFRARTYKQTDTQTDRQTYRRDWTPCPRRQLYSWRGCSDDISCSLLFRPTATAGWIISYYFTPIGGRSIAISVSVCLCWCLSVGWRHVFAWCIYSGSAAVIIDGLLVTHALSASTRPRLAANDLIRWRGEWPYYGAPAKCALRCFFTENRYITFQQCQTI